MVMRADPRCLLETGGTPAWLEAAAPALRLRARIERLGLPGAMAAEGVAELHPAAIDAVEFLDGELARLERAQRREDAQRRRRERQDR